MKDGNPKQQAAYQTIKDLNIFEDLHAYHPVLCGTIPIGVDVEESDLDIIMEVHDLAQFEKKLEALYGRLSGFKLKRKKIRGREVVKANFSAGGFELELFGQDQPVERQNAYVHMMVEHKVLEGNPALQSEIMKRRELGYKTEPAFCEALGISGDPYEELIRYGVKKGYLEEEESNGEA
ncbi:DUF4269 domain-containing protein [Halobacillus salinus]|uniref:DUF4269 domain-containing protein n=1 Tax=Halobacillus salinus TaxID=192814 RepID=A0A4Z0H160_9BACI|nr:DUF4269 domain-containing protein [Halobacillus salinus]TGB03587.1 DUF4269 domain-containing protein [Halobacillus salinus]